VDNMTTIRWWVDASYGTHSDCKGHTGMMMSLGKGAPMSMSRGQKLNTKSSTESELVGIDDALPQILWGKYFIEAQGYTVEHNILLQDNKSTILLATNGKFSSSKKTKHIKNRFFLIKDKIAQGDIEIQYEPTGRMWSDVLTKPKQGIAFREFRGQLMNVSEEYDDEVERLNTHPDLLPPAEDTKELLRKNTAVLIKALTSKALPRDTKAAVKAISERVAPGGTVAPRSGIRPRAAPKKGIKPRVALKQGFKSYQKTISSDAFTSKATFQARETPTRSRMVPSKASHTREKTVTFTNNEPFPRRTTAARAIKPRVVYQASPPQNYRRSVLGNLGNTGCKVRGDAPHRVRPRDMAKPVIARELAKERVLAGSRERVPARSRERVLAGTRARVLRGTPVGARALARAPGVRA
jgi:hypothetical protein